MDNNALKLYVDALNSINAANIEINRKKDRTIFILSLVTIVSFAVVLLFFIYQSYNYEGYPKTDITNTNTATNNK
jgi:hypothetical protein